MESATPLKRAKMWYDNISIKRCIFNNLWCMNAGVGKNFPKNIKYVLWTWKYMEDEKYPMHTIGVELEDDKYARITYDETHDFYFVTPCYDEDSLNDLKPRGLREQEWEDEGEVEWQNWDGDQGYRFDIADEV